MSEDRPIPEGIGAAVAAGTALAQVKSAAVDVPQLVVVPDGYQPVQIDVSAWREAPVRKTGIARPGTVEALEDYVLRHQTGSTTVWCDLEDATLTAVLDDHSTDDPGYGQHRAACKLEPTPQWNHWLEKDGKQLSQLDFADHVEVGLDDIIEPEAATILEMAQFFQANTGVSFQSSNRLQSGEQQLRYAEEIQAAAGRDGSITIPSGFKLGLEPFYGEERYALYARFRFRVAGGKLTMSYHLDRPDVVRRQALEKIVERLNDGRFSLAEVFVGKPR